MIVLHIGYDGVACYEIMKHGNIVNSVFSIEVFPFKMNVTYLIRKETLLFMLVQCVYISSRSGVMNLHASKYVCIFTCVFGMQKIDCVVLYVVVGIMCPNAIKNALSFTLCCLF